LARGVARRRATELREERRVADHDVERVVGQVGGERVGDPDACIWAEEPLALGNCPRVRVDTDDVAGTAEATSRGDQEVARAACRVENADRAGVEPGVEQGLERPVEEVLDEKRWGVEGAEPTAFVGAQPGAGARLRASAPCRRSRYRSSRKATCWRTTGSYFLISRRSRVFVLFLRVT
jgi:hypothetical protein